MQLQGKPIKTNQGLCQRDTAPGFLLALSKYRFVQTEGWAASSFRREALPVIFSRQLPSLPLAHNQQCHGYTH